MAPRRIPEVAGGSDRLLDVVTLGLAAWTVAYHVCLVLRLGVTWALVLALVVAFGWLVLGSRLAHGTDDRRGAPPCAPPRGAFPDLRSPWVLVTLVAAGVASLAMALDAPWPTVWVPWLVAAAAGTGWAVLRVPRPPTVAASPAETGAGAEPAWTALVVLAWAVGLAVLSLWVLRPNPDDLFYVNLSQWVAAHGTFPVRDTLFADLTYPMSNWPPVASYDGLVGAGAHLTGSRAGSVAYLVVPPIATVLSVLALWRLFRAWRVRHVAVVLSVALAFLLFDGTSAYGPPGNLFATRMWQGKVILLCLLVPLLLVHALAYVERPTRLRLLWLFTTGAAAVALSTTAIFLVPVIALAAMAPLVLRSWRLALAGFAAMAAYPLAAGVVTTLLGGRSADDFGARRQYRFDGVFIGHEIFLTGLIAVVGVLAVLLGALLVPHPAARVTTGLLVLVTGLMFVPGVTRASYDLTGLGPTLWRLSWGCTIAALVGLAVVRLAMLVPRRPVRLVLPVAFVVLLAAFGAPIWAESAGATWRTPLHWQRSHGSRAMAARAIAAAGPGGVVLAPDSLSITVAVTTTEVKTVAPRDYYMHYLRDDPRFHYRERLDLLHLVNHTTPWRGLDLARDLRVVGVDVACLRLPDVRRAAALEGAGFGPLATNGSYRCLHLN
ncbi:MAG: DUF6077 domain-containing protein [Nocardioides sp.]